MKRRRDGIEGSGSGGEEQAQIKGKSGVKALARKNGGEGFGGGVVPWEGSKVVCNKNRDQTAGTIQLHPELCDGNSHGGRDRDLQKIQFQRVGERN